MRGCQLRVEHGSSTLRLPLGWGCGCIQFRFSYTLGRNWDRHGACLITTCAAITAASRCSPIPRTLLVALCSPIRPSGGIQSAANVAGVMHQRIQDVHLDGRFTALRLGVLRCGSLVCSALRTSKVQGPSPGVNTPSAGFARTYMANA